MKIRDVLQWVKKKFEWKRPEQPAPIDTFSRGRQANTRITTEAEQVGTTLVPYAAFRLRSNALSRIEWEFYTDKQQEQNLEPTHWLPTLFDNPNPNNSLSELLALAMYWLDMKGECYLWTPRDPATNLPMQMWVIPASDVTTNYDVDSGGVRMIKSYTVSIAINNRLYAAEYEPDEVISVKQLIPRAERTNNGRGYATLDAMLPVATVQYDVAVAVEEYLQQGGLSNYYVQFQDQKTEEKFTKPKQEQLKSVLAEAGSNINMLFKLPAGMDIHDIRTVNGDGNAWTGELAGENGHEVIEMVAGTFGYLTQKDDSYASATIKRTKFIQETVWTYANLFGAAFTRWARQIDTVAQSTIYVTFKRESIEDPEQRRQRTQFEVSSGIITVNEYRQLNGYEVDEQMDGVRFVQASQMTYEQMLAMQYGLNQPGVTLSYDRLSPYERKQCDADVFSVKGFADAYWKRYDEIDEKAAKAIANDLQPAFDELEVEVIKRVNLVVRNVNTNGIVTKAGEQPIVLNDLFDVVAWGKIFADYASGTVEQHQNDIISEAIDDLGDAWEDLPSTFDDARRNALRESLQKISTASGTINEELKRDLSAVILDNLDQTVAERTRLVVEKVNAMFDSYRVARANNIARTTTTYNTGASQTIAWEQSVLQPGVQVIPSWLSERDSKTRKTHARADGQIKGSITPNGFKVGTDQMRWPGGGSQAKENCNCRCKQRPKINRREINIHLLHKYMRLTK